MLKIICCLRDLVFPPKSALFYVLINNKKRFVQKAYSIRLSHHFILSGYFYLDTDTNIREFKHSG